MAANNANLKYQYGSIDPDFYTLNPYWIKGAEQRFPAIASLYGTELTNPKLVDNYDAIWYFDDGVYLNSDYINTGQGMYLKIIDNSNYLQNKSSAYVSYAAYSYSGGTYQQQGTGGATFTACEGFDFTSPVEVSISYSSSEHYTYYIPPFDESDKASVYPEYDYLSLGRYCCPSDLGGVLHIQASANTLNIGNLSNWFFNGDNYGGTPNKFNLSVESAYDFVSQETTDRLNIANINYFDVGSETSVTQGDSTTMIQVTTDTIDSTWTYRTSEAIYLPVGDYSISADSFDYKIVPYNDSLNSSDIGIEIVEYGTSNRIAFLSALWVERDRPVTFTLNSAKNVQLRSVEWHEDGVLRYQYVEKITNLMVSLLPNTRYFTTRIAAQGDTSISLVTPVLYNNKQNVYQISNAGTVPPDNFDILQAGNILETDYTGARNFTIKKLPPVTMSSRTAYSVTVTWASNAVGNDNPSIRAVIANDEEDDIIQSITVNNNTATATFTDLSAYHDYYVWLEKGNQTISENSIYYTKSNVTQVATLPDGADALTLSIDRLTYENAGYNWGATQSALAEFIPASPDVPTTFWTNTSAGHQVYIVNLLSTDGALVIVENSPTITISGNAVNNYGIPIVDERGWTSHSYPHSGNGNKFIKIALPYPASYPNHHQYSFTVQVSGTYTYNGTAYPFSKSITKTIPPAEEEPD